jgi:hypothetical protein
MIAITGKKPEITRIQPWRQSAWRLSEEPAAEAGGRVEVLRIVKSPVIAAARRRLLSYAGCRIRIIIIIFSGFPKKKMTGTR